MNPEALAALPPDQLAGLLGSAAPLELVKLRWRMAWLTKARKKQLPPDHPWFIWFIMSGRGFGKTLSAAQWLAWEAICDPPGDVNSISHVIAPTTDDHRKTTFEGPTGLINVIPHELIAHFIRSPYSITLVNGSKILGFEATTPESLRGPQCKRAWCEEVGSWQYDEATWDMMIMGLRLGPAPQVCVTGTPKPRPLVQRLVKHERTVLVPGTTYENRANLPKSFFDELLQYEGTRLGRQELHGELLDMEEMGVIRRSWLRTWPAAKGLPEFTFIVLSLDTAFTEKTTDEKTWERDPTACTVWGVFHETVVVEDRYKWPEKKALPAVMLLDAWQDMYGLPDLIARVKREMKARYGAPTRSLIEPMFGPQGNQNDGRKVDLLLIEDKGSGISLRQMLERDGISAYAYNPGRADKLARLHVVSPLFARGRVFIPESPLVAEGKKPPGSFPAWAGPVIEQLCAFSGEGSLKHDDFVDTTSQALRVLADFGELRAVDEQTLREEVARVAEARVKGVNLNGVYGADGNGYSGPTVEAATENGVNPYAS